jgi:3-oxoacyl-[acyl-carrier-protein] synthase-3
MNNRGADNSTTTNPQLPANACVLGTGSYLPERELTNDELSQTVDTNDEWISTRTGIRARRIAADDEYPSHMGAEAARVAMADAGVSADEIDLIICATSTPDMIYPSTACFIQAMIGAKNAGCFDLTAACSGYCYALDVAAKYVQTGGARRVLIIGAEKKSAIVNWQDRNVCVLFGDGASAAVIGPRDDSRGVIHTCIGADGHSAGVLYHKRGGHRPPLTSNPLGGEEDTVQMNGREVYKFAVHIIGHCIDDALEHTGVALKDIDWFIPHQANLRILESIAKKRGIPMEKFVVNLDKYGNTSAAAAGIALDESIRDGRVKRGDLVLLITFGGGLSWASALLEY